MLQCKSWKQFFFFIDEIRSKDRRTSPSDWQAAKPKCSPSVVVAKTNRALTRLFPFVGIEQFWWGLIMLAVNNIAKRWDPFRRTILCPTLYLTGCCKLKILNHKIYLELVEIHCMYLYSYRLFDAFSVSQKHIAKSRKWKYYCLPATHAYVCDSNMASQNGATVDEIWSSTS